MSRKKTEAVLTEDILNTLDLTKWFNFGYEKFRMEKKLNEYYQFHPDCFREVNSGNYSFLERVITNSVFDLEKEFEYTNR